MREISQYKRLQSQVHRGPLYTQPTKRDATAPAKTFGEDQFNRQYSTNPKADFDPFTGVETYSQRLQPKVNEIPKLSGRPFSTSTSSTHFAMTNALQTKNSSLRNSGQHLRAKRATTSANILIAPMKRNQPSWQA
jgi:hypothetical protein